MASVCVRDATGVGGIMLSVTVLVGDTAGAVLLYSDTADSVRVRDCIGDGNITVCVTIPVDDTAD